MPGGQQVACLEGLGQFCAARGRLQQIFEDILSTIHDRATVPFEPPQRKRRVDCLQDVWSASMALKVTVNDKPRGTSHGDAARYLGFRGRCRQVYAGFGERDVVDDNEGRWCTKGRLGRRQMFARIENYNKYLTSARTVVYGSIAIL